MAHSANGLPRILVVGGGKMGEALVAGWIASDEGASASLSASDIVVANPGRERRDLLEARYGVSTVADARDAGRADIVVLAVKPQVIDGVLADIASASQFSPTTAGPLFTSIAAGVTCARMEAALPAGARVVRTMPNLPLQVGAGATAVSGGSNATEDDVSRIRDLFSCLGDAVIVPEEALDAVTGVSGSGPAYVAALIEAMAKGGAQAGLAPELAERLALQTVWGTARVLLEKDLDVAEFRAAVCSPGGTTLAGLAAMEDAGFSSSVVAGVTAATARSKELAG